MNYCIIATFCKFSNNLYSPISAPRVTAHKGVITIYAPTDGVIDRADIYATNGARVDMAEGIRDEHSVALPSAVYIVRLVVDGCTYTYKILLR